MSNYRDDTMETAYISDKVWMNLKTHVEEFTKISTVLVFAIGLSLTENIRAYDDVYAAQGQANITELIHVLDSSTGHRTATTKVMDQVRIRDSVKTVQRIEYQDNVSVSEAWPTATRAKQLEQIKISDTWNTQRNSRISITEKIKVRDLLKSNDIGIAEDLIQVGDSIQGQLKARHQTIDHIIIAVNDVLPISLRQNVNDQVKANDQATGRLQAIQQIEDQVFIQDSVNDELKYGQAWVANIKQWAMSRYEPFNFHGLSVINGKLYGWNDQGVFLCGIEGEHIDARMTTPKLDFGDALVYPTASYLEYQLAGENKQLSIQVTTTQTGQPQSYQYLLPKEASNYLTNGRVIFGRGLRGRHFSFDITIQGTSAEINAMSIEYTKTARRI